MSGRPKVTGWIDGRMKPNLPGLYQRRWTGLIVWDIAADLTQVADCATSATHYQHVTTVWECDHCCEVHDTEDEALDCCPARATAGYQCVACGERSTKVDDLAHCCEAADVGAEAAGDVAMTADAWAAQMQSVEAAGQLRLLP